MDKIIQLIAYELFISSCLFLELLASPANQGAQKCLNKHCGRNRFSQHIIFLIDQMYFGVYAKRSNIEPIDRINWKFQRKSERLPPHYIWKIYSQSKKRLNKTLSCKLTTDDKRKRLTQSNISYEHTQTILIHSAYTAAEVIKC